MNASTVLAVALTVAELGDRPPTVLRSADALATQCAARDDQSACLEYLAGVADTVEILIALGALPREICLPAEVDPQVLRQVVLAFVHRRTLDAARGPRSETDVVDHSRRSASALAISAWAAAFPCR